MTSPNSEKPKENKKEESLEAEEKVVEEVKDPAETLKSQLLYQRAEFDNYKKRILREQETAIRFGNEKLVQELMGVLDLFDLALTHSQKLKAKPDEDVAKFVSGIELTHKELVQLLSRFGVEFIDSAGEKFDPQRHEAISEAEVADESHGNVIQILQRGCLLNGRLLKPAKVIVGKKKD